MSENIVITQNDTGIEIAPSFVSNNGSTVDLTDSTIKVKTVTPSGRVLESNAVVDNPLGGVAYIVLTNDYTSELGLHTMYWSIEQGVSKITAQQDVNYFVKQRLGGKVDA